MTWKTCDACDRSDGYTDANPFVELRTPRPSDPSDMCCVMAGHKNCFARNATLPDIGRGGIATPEQWATWIESKEAQAAGFVFLT